MKLKPLLLFSLAAGLALSAQADLNLDISADIRIGRAAPPPPPEVIVIERVGPPGPPPWAASHPRQHAYAYYYYPASQVYYRPDTHLWFYLDGRTWRTAARLPDYVRVDFGRAVPLTLENDRPYSYHQKVVAYYPSNYFNRVKIKNDHNNSHDDHRDQGHDNGNGKGKGNDDHGKGNDKDKHH